MNFVINNIKWLMLLAGIITSSMAYAIFDPQYMLINLFGVTLVEPLADVIVRSWGVLITLMGGLLIYGACYPKYRNIALVLVTMSKAMFIAIVVIFGAEFIGKASMTLALDFAFVAIFLVYLIHCFMQKRED